MARLDQAKALATAFDLGVPAGGLTPVAGGRMNLMWRLRTDRGEWAVKQLNRSREAWWLAAYETAVEVERAAYRQGVPMPRPVPPPLVDLTVHGGPVSYRVHEWCHGSRLPDRDVPHAVLGWVGHTLASLHARAAPSPPDEPAPHTLTEWDSWLGPPTPWTERVRSYFPDIARAIVAVERAGPGHHPVLTHRDVKPDNVLVTRRTPVLVDWDGAGADFAEREAVRSALAFSRIAGGWQRRRFVAVLRAYRAAGGAPVPAEPRSFAGVLRHQLAAAAYLVWRALGHRPVSPPERAAARGHALEFLAELRATLAGAADWTSWIAGE
ncbi:phosphotransferase [Rhizomonospora bruguierae]|uniref:phosphotransferase n=1 Tax=Rhizomonospora bruguierae TaxID=1581705 RepID=UPI001BCB7B3D|nr:aminoglycoside phosphotransferase family protein [Micromonospora sp. NBRC 107566]